MDGKKSRPLGLLAGFWGLASAVGMLFFGRWFGSGYMNLRALLKRTGSEKSDEWKAIMSAQMQQYFTSAAVSIAISLLMGLIAVWLLHRFIQLRCGAPPDAWAKRNRTLVLGYGALGLVCCPFLGWGIYRLALFLDYSEKAREYGDSWGEIFHSFAFLDFLAKAGIFMFLALGVFVLACVLMTTAAKNLADPKARREKQEAEQRRKQAKYMAESGLYVYGPPQAPPAEALFSLQQLKQMLDEGLITPQDYEAKKKDLLDRM